MDTNEVQLERSTTFFKRIIPTWLGSLILVLCATFAGMAVKFNELSYKVTEAANVPIVHVQKTETENATTTVSEITNGEIATTTKK
jgi:hypothetical protein